jgi:hypothetical protein
MKHFKNEIISLCTNLKQSIWPNDYKHDQEERQEESQEEAKINK